MTLKAAQQASNPNIYLGQWEFTSSPENGDVWQAPGGDAVGLLDLRNDTERSQRGGTPGFGIFVYDGTRNHPELLTNLGTARDGNLNPTKRDAIEQNLGMKRGDIKERSIQGVVKEILLTKGDNSGQNGFRSLQSSTRHGTKIFLGGLGWLVNERLEARKSAWDATIAIFREQYSRERPLASTQAQLDELRRYTGYTMRLLGIRDASIILPPAYVGDGWLPPHTTLTETWDTGDSDTINADLNWTEVEPNFTIASNKLNAAENDPSAGNVSARAEVNLSGNNQSGDVDVTWVAATSRHGGLGLRFGSHNTYYRLVGIAQLDSDQIQHVEINGTATTLASDAHTVGAETLNVSGSINDSTLTLLVEGGNTITVTDTSIPFGLKAGVAGRNASGDVQWDDWSMSDLIGGGAISGFGFRRNWASKIANRNN